MCSAHLSAINSRETRSGREQDLRLVVGPARHEAEEKKERDHERIESLANPYRHKIHEMPPRISRRAQRRHFVP